MPTYDYKCQQCEHTFEYFQAMSDARLENCPECEGKVRRLVSGGSGLIFRGVDFTLRIMPKRIPPARVKICLSLKRKRKNPKKKVQNHEYREAG